MQDEKSIQEKWNNFKTTWEGLIAEIKKVPIDGDGVRLIRVHFEVDQSLFKIGLNRSEFTHTMIIELRLLDSKLNVALAIAHSEFRLRNRGILAKVFGGIVDKIPTTTTIIEKKA